MSNEKYDDLFTAEDEKPIDYKAILFEYLMYWPWFVACLILCLIGAWGYLRYQTPVYNVNATVLIKQDDKGKGSANSPLATMQDLGMLSMAGNFDNEMEILHSRTLIKKVVNTLGLNIRYDMDYAKALRQIGRIEADGEMELDDMQKTAVLEAARNGVLIITGGPGTGKTTTINAIIRFFENEGMEIRLAAPTGRAAKRMTEATGYEAQTIHRMLELSGGPDAPAGSQFQRNEDHPLEADAIIIDEMSMVDIHLMHALLKAILPGTRLIMVGDVNQLPSVGPGNVLKDIIASHCFNVVKLTKIFRQAMESAIVTNAHKINDGEPLDLDRKTTDFFCLKRYQSKDILGVIIALARDILPKNVHASAYDIQVLTPMRKGELGVENLNSVLQRYLNPASPDKREKEHGGILFREGDKVMQIKNDYQLEWEVTGAHNLPVDKGVGVFNGDIGILREINFFAEQVMVEFDEGRKVHYPFSELEELELAYAITVHKSQGSEYPAVVLPLLSGPRMLFNRNILYTAVTRAKNCVAIVGSDAAVEQMIRNERQQRRYSSLDIRIGEAE